MRRTGGAWNETNRGAWIKTNSRQQQTHIMQQQQHRYSFYFIGCPQQVCMASTLILPECRTGDAPKGSRGDAKLAANHVRRLEARQHGGEEPLGGLLDHDVGGRGRGHFHAQLPVAWEDAAALGNGGHAPHRYTHQWQAVDVRHQSFYIPVVVGNGGNTSYIAVNIHTTTA